MAKRKSVRLTLRMQYEDLTAIVRALNTLGEALPVSSPECTGVKNLAALLRRNIANAMIVRPDTSKVYEQLDAQTAVPGEVRKLLSPARAERERPSERAMRVSRGKRKLATMLENSGVPAEPVKPATEGGDK